MTVYPVYERRAGRCGHFHEHIIKTFLDQSDAARFIQQDKMEQRRRDRYGERQGLLRIIPLEVDAGKTEADWETCARIAINAYDAGRGADPPNEEYEKGWADACHRVMKLIEAMFKQPKGEKKSA